MTIPLLSPDSTPDAIALAERLGLEGRERILSRVHLGTPLLVSIKIEADYISEAWAHFEDKVQICAIQIAFEELRHQHSRGLVEPLPRASHRMPP